MPKDKWDEYLKDIDTGRKRPGTLREGRQSMPSTPLPRPKGGIFEMGDKKDMPKPRSYAPKGMGNAVKGDLGAYRQEESQKVTRKKLGGRSISNPLHYRAPDTAIDAAYGPGDKVC